MPFTISTPRDNIPPGTYTGVLTKVENDESEYGTFNKWFFLVDVNGKAIEISAVTSTNTGPRSKAYKWLTALLRRPLQSGETIDDPIGQKAILTIGDNEKGFSTVQEVAPFEGPAEVLPGVPR